jgi:hypothetical protein
MTGIMSNGVRLVAAAVVGLVPIGAFMAWASSAAVPKPLAVAGAALLGLFVWSVIARTGRSRGTSARAVEDTLLPGMYVLTLTQCDGDEGDISAQEILHSPEVVERVDALKHAGDFSLTVSVETGEMTPTWMRMLGRRATYLQRLALLSRRGNRAVLILLDENGSEYRAHEPDDCEPSGRSESLPEERAFAALREFIATGRRPKLLASHFVR